MDLAQLTLWCKALEAKLGRNRHLSGVCQADLDILDPDDVQEPFFKPLMKQLTAFLQGRNGAIEYSYIELSLGDGIRVGRVPWCLSVIEDA